MKSGDADDAPPLRLAREARGKPYCRVPALVELLTSKLKVAPLSRRRLPVLRLSVDPPSAEALVD